MLQTNFIPQKSFLPCHSLLFLIKRSYWISVVCLFLLWKSYDIPKFRDVIRNFTDSLILRTILIFRDNPQPGYIVIRVLFAIIKIWVDKRMKSCYMKGARGWWNFWRCKTSKYNYEVFAYTHMCLHCATNSMILLCTKPIIQISRNPWN